MGKKHLPVCKILATILPCVAMLIGVTSFAQQVPVKGKVIDVHGEPIVGASVFVERTNQGTVTNVDGVFELRVANGTPLVVSCIGFITQTVTASNDMAVTLEEDRLLLDETVVVGYGTMKKRM